MGRAVSRRRRPGLWISAGGAQRCGCFWETLCGLSPKGPAHPEPSHPLRPGVGTPSYSSAGTLGPCCVCRSPSEPSAALRGGATPGRAAGGRPRSPAPPRPGRRPAPHPCTHCLQAGRWPLTFPTEREAWTVFKATAMLSINSGGIPQGLPNLFFPVGGTGFLEG